MKIIVSVLVVSLIAAPSLQALDRHPLKVWLAENPGKDNHRGVDEKKESSQAKRNAIKGALITGVMSGARALLLHQDVAKAIVVGAAVGAAAGFVIGKIQDRQIADRGALEQRVGYDASRGIVAEVTDMTCDPCRVKPGQPVHITVSYYALRPERAALTISRHLGVRAGGSYVKVVTFDPDPFTMSDGGGQFETTLEYSFDKEATYTLDWLVESDSASIEKARNLDIIVSNSV